MLHDQVAVLVVAIFATDIVLVWDSVSAVYGITGDPFLVFATNAFALLELGALLCTSYCRRALSKLVHLGYDLAIIRGLIRGKLVLHGRAATGRGRRKIRRGPLRVIVTVLMLVTATSLYATRRGGGPPGSAHLATVGAVTDQPGDRNDEAGRSSRWTV